MEGLDPDAELDRFGFDPAETVLTRRQAEVLALRERGLTQQEVAERWGTSRANVASVERSARRNLERARETLGFAERLQAPNEVEIDAGTDLYDVPDHVFEVCDDRGVKAELSAVELIQAVADGADRAVSDGSVRRPVVVEVTPDGDIRDVRVPPLSGDD